MLMATWKVAPALAAGNCCVLKPSEMASLTCLELAAIGAAAGLPAGVLNVLTGTGVEAGKPSYAMQRCLRSVVICVVCQTGSCVRVGRGLSQSAVSSPSFSSCRRRRPVHPPAGRQGRLHRLCRHRAARQRGRRQQPAARHHGTGRQVGPHRV